MSNVTLSMPCYRTRARVITFLPVFPWRVTFADYLHKWLGVYVDDIIQWAMTDKEALEQYSLLFQRLVKVGMQLKPSKCIFFAKEIEILGHRVTQEGRTAISRGVEAILSMPTPTNISAVKRFLGLCGYFRDLFFVFYLFIYFFIFLKLAFINNYTN